MRFSKMLPVVLLITAVLASSCSKSKDEVLVAKVGDRAITVADFEKAFLTVNQQYMPTSEGHQQLVDFLDIMINKEVMAIKADELGYDKDEFVVQGMEAYKKVGLQAAYLKYKVADRINVTEEDLREAYERYGLNLNVKQILVDTKEEADQVYNMLQEGHDFETVCKEYSKGPDAAEGGRVVNALFGTFPPNFNQIFDLSIGEVSKPILSDYGYFIIKVMGRSKTSRDSFEEARYSLEKILETHQRITYSNEVSDAIRAKHNFQIYEGNIKTAFEALPPDRPLTNPPDRRAEVYPLLRYEPQDLDKPLVSYDDVTISIRDFSDLYDRSSFFERPRRDRRLTGIKQFLLHQVMNDLVMEEMEESGIENEPEIAKMLNRKREQLMVDKLYQDLIVNQAQVTYQETDKYYKDNIEQFRQAESRRFGMVLTGDMSAAQEAYDKLKKGADFSDVVMEYSIDNPTKETNGDTDFIVKGTRPDIDQHGFTLDRVGQITEPFETERGWMVLKLFEKRPERILTVEEAQDDIQHILEQRKNNERLNALLEKWKSEIEIKTYENNLEKADVDERPESSPVKFS